ncbi:MAG TPA: hypothetical protein VII41_01545 [Steroidobacteraceae bacterium]
MDAIQTPSNSDARRLQRDLAWLLAVKFAALGLLWLLFFSAAHPVDASAASRQLAVAGLTP